jgi:pSer/pThr/pTyr-binding forkhead associated (FHA) protein
MPVRLTIHPPRTDKPRVVEFDDARVTIGRSSKCDIRLPFRIVSSHHLTIIQSANSLQVRDEKSTNGTLLDGQPLIAGTDRRLAWGATLEIVDLSIAVESIPDLDAGVSLGKTGTMARLMLGEALLSGAQSGPDQSGPDQSSTDQSSTDQSSTDQSSTDQSSTDQSSTAHPGSAPDGELEAAYFDVIKGPAKGQRPQLPDDLKSGLISDHEDALICLPGLTVALEILRDGDGFGLGLAQEAQPKAGLVTLNDMELTKHRRLNSGDTITVGSTVVRFVDPLEAYLNDLDGVIPPSDVAKSPHNPAIDTLEDASLDVGSDRGVGSVQIAPVEPEPSKSKKPDSSKRSLGVIEVGVIAVSLVVLVGVIFFLLSIFGML